MSLTSEQIAEIIADVSNRLGFAQPLFVRLPKSGLACPHSSLSRSAMDLLVRPQEANNFRPPVKSRILKHGTKKGIVLVEYASLMAYLNNLPDGSETSNRYRKALTPTEKSVLAKETGE